MRASLLLALPLFACAACDDTPEKSDAAPYDALAAAKADGQVIAGALGVTAPANVVNGNVSRAAPRQTWTLDVRPGAVLDLEVTHAGTTAALDTVLTVVGPVTSDDATSPVVAEDDDSGWGLHSKLKGLTLGAGSGGRARYLVTVQSYDGRQKGKYRLVATCRSAACEPEPTTGEPTDDRYCHPTLRTGIARCIDSQLADVDRDPTTWTALDIGRACADAEPLGALHDAVCTSERPAPTWCALDYESFMNTQASLCADDAVAYALARECVLGAGYRDLREARGHLSVTRRRVITAGAPLDALEREQLVAAVRVAYEDASDVASALGSVDGGEVNQLHVWDATAHRGFVSYEYGAGDNSYGAVLTEGAATLVAEIRDGDFYVPGQNLVGCPAAGDELATCATSAECTGGMRCVGVTGGRGRCSAEREYPGETAECRVTAESNGCPVASGLVCAGVDASGAGLCLPAWQGGSFDDYAVAHIPAHGTLERTLTAWGLTTVSTDVTARLVADFATPADLKITLTNPATTVGVVWDHESGALELARAIRAYPGDESANGAWILTIENRGATTGTLVSWGLDIMSRWD